MSNKYLEFDQRLITYLREVSLQEPEVLRRLREETATHPHSQMQISPEQGQFLGFLVELIQARRILEIGTFTGYSALRMALSMPSAGRLTACDVDPETAAVAQRYWEEAGVAHKIRLVLAPALETLATLEPEFDMVFIDADKPNYASYFEEAMRLVRPGGLILLDNVLWSGKVADPSAHDPETQALRTMNRKLRNDARVTISLLPIADGLTLALKRN